MVPVAEDSRGFPAQKSHNKGTRNPDSVFLLQIHQIHLRKEGKMAKCSVKAQSYRLDALTTTHEKETVFRLGSEWKC